MSEVTWFPGTVGTHFAGLPVTEGNREMTTSITLTRYVLRDRATKGCDFLVWGDGDETAAQQSLRDALADGLDVELVTMPSDGMDAFTKRLIEGS